MPFYEISFDADAYQSLQLTHPNTELKILNQPDWFIGTKIGEQWSPIRVSVSYDPLKKEGAFPSIGGIPPVFTKTAVQILRPLLEGSVELLPMMCADQELFAVNIIDIADCLDYNLSQLKRFSSGRVMRIERYIFKPNCLNDKNIFKIPEQVRNRVYVSELFKQTVERNNLQGMLFQRLDE